LDGVNAGQNKSKMLNILQQVNQQQKGRNKSSLHIRTGLPDWRA